MSGMKLLQGFYVKVKQSVYGLLKTYYLLILKGFQNTFLNHQQQRYGTIDVIFPVCYDQNFKFRLTSYTWI